MLKFFIFVTGVLTQDIPAKCSYNAARDEFPGGSFPKGFKWSLATASYQIEGSWDVDGKGEQIWDKFSHRKPCSIDNCQNGDIACDSYRHTDRDIEQLVKVGVKVSQIKNKPFELSAKRPCISVSELSVFDLMGSASSEWHTNRGQRGEPSRNRTLFRVY